MNVSDSEVVRTLLYEDGLREAESAATADIVLNPLREETRPNKKSGRGSGIFAVEMERGGPDRGRARMHGGARQRRLV